jgi:hypothetical protein
MAVPDTMTLQALAREVTRLLARSAQPDALLTARQVATRFNVDRGWVYAHADELGVIRLGNGPRPRLRFDPAVVAQRLLIAAAPASPRRPAAPASTTAPLLPITPSRPRRNLNP